MDRDMRLWLCGALMLALLSPFPLSMAEENGPGYPDAGAGRSIVVIANNVSITLAQGTFDSGLGPFPDQRSGEASMRAGFPLALTGQLVDGNYTLLSYGGGREAARKNNGVAGHNEEVRWWFNGVEQTPVPVAWSDSSRADDGSINGTFTISNWIPDSSLVPRAGVYEMRLSFDGTRMYYPGYGEFQIYPPCEKLIPVRVLFPTESAITSPVGSVDAGSAVEISGTVKGGDGGLPWGGVVVSADGRTLGPALPEGLYIDDVEVVIPGIPTVVFHDGFEGAPAGWLHGGDGEDWEAGTPTVGPAPHRGQACLGTNLDGSYSHLADEWAETPPVNLTNFKSPVTLSFACWLNLSAGDYAELTIWNGTGWSDAVRIPGPMAEWHTVSVDLETLTEAGKPFGTQGVDGLKARFRLKSVTPSAVVAGGTFSLDWSVPDDASPGPTTLALKYVPLGNYTSSFTYRKVNIRGKLGFEVPDGVLKASPGGWVEVKARIVDSRGAPPEMLSGQEGSTGLHVLWDNSTGLPIEAESITAVNGTGWFAAAHHLGPGERLGDSRFILSYDGDAYHQGAEGSVSALVMGQPALQLNPAAPAWRGKVEGVSGRLMLGKSPLADSELRLMLPFEPWSVNVTTNPMGNFSASFLVPLDWNSDTVHLELRTMLADTRLLNASASLEILLTRSLSVQLGDSLAAKGQRVRTSIGTDEFEGLAGRVTDDNGNGVAGGAVVIEELRSGGSVMLGKCTTGPSGYFSLQYTVPWTGGAGPVQLRALASASAAAPGQDRAVLTVTARTMLTLNPLPVLRPGSLVYVSGVLREDWNGAPGDLVRDMPVVVSFAGQPSTVYTDAGGRFNLRVAVTQSSGAAAVRAWFAGVPVLSSSSAESSAEVRPVQSTGDAPTVPGPTKLAPGSAAVAGASVVAVCAAAAAIGGTEAGRVKLLIGLVPLYSKIRKEAVLDQFIRGQVFGYVQANPGDHYSSIRESLKLKNGTLAYHLRTLEREQFVFSRMDGIYRRFYPTGADPARVRLYRNLKETPRKFLEMIEKHPGITPKELGEKLGTSHQVASYHVRLLARKGRIRIEERGRNTLCYPADGVTGAGGAGQ